MAVSLKYCYQSKKHYFLNIRDHTIMASEKNDKFFEQQICYLKTTESVNMR